MRRTTLHQGNQKSSALLALALLLLTVGSIKAQSYFRNWPKGSSPQEIGKRVAENFAARKLEVEEGKRKFVIYPEVCAWYGSLTVAQLVNDQDLRKRLIEKFDPLLAEHASWIASDAHVDYRVFGVVPLEIYYQTKQQKYLELGRALADKQWDKTTPDGITTEARYWIDDMYMITGCRWKPIAPRMIRSIWIALP